MGFRKNEICVRCRTQIAPDQPALGISIFAQTLGMGTKRKASKSERIYICPQCSVVTAMGDEPPKGQPFNVAVYRVIRNMVGTDGAVVAKAWEELNQAVITPPGLPTGEVLPPARSLKAG